MDVELVKTRWKDCKSLWDELYIGNPYLSPYQDYTFLDQIKNSANIHLIKDLLFSKNEYYLVRSSGRTIGILPLQVDSRNKQLFLLGHLCSVGHLDFIYGEDYSYSDFYSLLNAVFHKYKGYSLILDRISQYSMTYKYLVKNELFKELIPSVCVRIDISSYDLWFKGLGKSCRQNIRTAYNRIAKEGKVLKAVCKIGEYPTKAMKKDNLNLLAKRLIEHNKMSKRYISLIRVLKSTEPFTKALFASKNFIGANIYIDNVPIAICNGLIANDGRAIITRLSIDISYGVYCPGGLIINELIKAVTDTHPEVKAIDLSRGDEKYKYTYGGYDHLNYDFVVEL